MSRMAILMAMGQRFGQSTTMMSLMPPMGAARHVVKGDSDALNYYVADCRMWLTSMVAGKVDNGARHAVGVVMMRSDKAVDVGDGTDVDDDGRGGDDECYCFAVSATRRVTMVLI